MLLSFFRSRALGPAFAACAICVVAASGARASDDAHAPGPKAGAHAPAETASIAGATTPATSAVAASTATAVKPVAVAAATTAAAPKTDAAAPRAIGKDGKPIPTATPQEVAARIAEKMAMLRARQAERASPDGHVRAAAPAAAVRRPLQIARADAEPRLAAPGSTDTRIGLAAADARHAPHWSYGGDEGPVRWAEMNPEWAKCGSGQRQSPIDIKSGIKVELEPIVFDYRVSGFSVIDNGHTIQVNLGAGNAITVSGRTYELLQFHFHRPSEEKINGRGYDMVAHLVHRDGAGKLAVVAVLIERGAARALVQTVWNNLPLEKNEAVTPAGALDMNGILPARRDYYTYMGSLTTPPCSEGVLWMVMKEPVSVSQDQLDIFARLYQMNARPIQLTAERLIKESN